VHRTSRSVLSRKGSWTDSVRPHVHADALCPFRRRARQSLITEREIELGGLLLPHIRRAVTISNVLDVKTIERSRLAETPMPYGAAWF
jgi:hypothetical protein